MYPQESNFDKIVSAPMSVVIACDHPGMSSDLARILGEQFDINVMLACNSGELAVTAIRQFAPDVALLDVEISDLEVVDVLANIMAGGLKTKVVCLTRPLSGHDFSKEIVMGAKGILSKDEATSKIVDCIREVFYGNNWFPPDTLPEREVMRRRQRNPRIRALTARERQIALLVCEGLSNKQLGHQLNVTEGTVKVHLHKIYRKLGVRNRAALSALATTSRAFLRSGRSKRSEIVGQMA
jgi:two-component system nitrate/nitrite response regulator NarL